MTTRLMSGRAVARACLYAALGCTLGASLAPLARLLTQPAHAAEPEAIEQLIENARYWQARNRPDKAAEAWRKILRAVPTHAEALAELALHEARVGNQKLALGYLERLRAVAPGHSQIKTLETVLGLGGKYDEALDAARAAIRAGRFEEGLALYRKALGTDSPGGDLGLEYYQALGGSPNGWAPARAGMERLVADNPGATRFELALARHLTYDETTRRDGIARLERLLGGAEGAKADAALRQALLWLGVTAADAPVIERYLARNPGDSQVRKKLDEHRSGLALRGFIAAERERLKAGYLALDAGEYEQAEILFRAAVKANPRDAEAMAGLASALMGLERFDEALAILRELSEKVAKKERQLWEGLLAQAAFWAPVKRAEAARAAGRLAEAEALLVDAIAANPRLAAHGELLLANVLSDTKRFDEAAPLFEKLAAADPQALPPLLGLLEVQIRRGSLDKAIEVNQRILLIAPDKGISEAWLRSEILRRQATEAKNEGHLREARSILMAAEELDPSNLGVLAEHAYLALQLKDLVDARRVADRLLEVAPKDRDSRLVNAWVAYAEGRYQAALESVQAIAGWKGDDALRDLRRRIEVQLGVEDAVRLANRGKMIASQTRLTDLHRMCMDSPEMLGLVANAWADIGRFEQALATMRDALAAAADSTTLKLQLAAILHKARREKEFLAVMAEVEATKDLTPEQQIGYANLLVAWSVRRADAARERGNLPRAFTYLQAPLKDNPSDVRLINALGRLFLSGGEYDEAYRTFARVLAVEHANREALEGMIRAAVELGRVDEARRLAQEALKTHDDDPNVLLVVGRMHVMLGEDSEAKQLLDRALALEEGLVQEQRGIDSPISRLIADAAARFGQKPSDDHGIVLHAAIERELANIRGRHAIRTGAGFSVRARSGEEGLGQLAAFEFPIVVSIPTGYIGRLTLTATPIYADAGTVDLGSKRLEGTLGSSGVDLFGIASGRFDQSANAIELHLAQDIGVLHLEIGTTPLGFLTQTIVGGAALAVRVDALGLKLEAFRRAVEDTLMSWSGVYDPGTDAVIGGVIENGGRLDVGVDVDDVTVFVFGGARYLHGSHVADNKGYELGLGVHWRLHDRDGVRFSTGLDGFSRFYEKNLRHFTLGHGGYFSPRTHVVGSLPLELALAHEDYDLNASASLGVAWLDEAAAPYYPTDPERMLARSQLTYEDDTPVAANYSASDNLAFVLDARIAFTYRASPSVQLGAGFRAHRGYDYEEFAFGTTFTYVFDQQVDEDLDDLDLPPSELD